MPKIPFSLNFNYQLIYPQNQSKDKYVLIACQDLVAEQRVNDERAQNLLNEKENVL